MSSFNPESKIFSGESFPQVFHPNISVGHLLLHHFRLAPERIVQINADDGVEVNGEEMSVLMKKAAAFLTNQGLKFGDAVGFCASNTTNLAPAVFACLLLGLPITTVNTRLSVNQIVPIFRRTQPKLIFCEHEQVDKVQEVLQTLNFCIEIVLLTDEVESLMNFKKDIIETVEVLDVPHEFNISSDKVCAAIFATSGTTGEPKLARISHAQLSQSVYAFLELKNDSIVLNFSSFFWICGITAAVHSVLNQQTRLFTREKFTPRKCVELVEKYKVVILDIISPEVFSLEKYMQTAEIPDGCLKSIKMISTGACPITLKTIKAMESLLDNGRVQVEYGMTESCGVITRSDSCEPVSNSVGKLCINTRAKILTDTGTLGGIGEVGEILLKRPFNIIDYLDNEQQTRDYIDDESWVHTGDVGYFDENLNLFFVGRKKLMIRCNHREVNPLEIEEVINSVPGVLQVCVVGLEDIFYYVPAAVIKKSPESDLTEADIQEAVKHLEDYKQLRGGIFFIDDLPMTATGKLNRIAIEEIAYSLTKEYHLRSPS